jgi:hypothetical protein
MCSAGRYAPWRPPLSVGSKSLSGSGMSKVAMQFVPVSVEITGKHIVPFAVYRQCNNIPAAIIYDDQPGGNAHTGLHWKGLQSA